MPTTAARNRIDSVCVVAPAAGIGGYAVCVARMIIVCVTVPPAGAVSFRKVVFQSSVLCFRSCGCPPPLVPFHETRCSPRSLWCSMCSGNEFRACALRGSVLWLVLVVRLRLGRCSPGFFQPVSINNVLVEGITTGDIGGVPRVSKLRPEA